MPAGVLRRIREALRSRAPVPRAVGVLVGLRVSRRKDRVSLTCWVTLVANLLGARRGRAAVAEAPRLMMRETPSLDVLQL